MGEATRMTELIANDSKELVETASLGTIALPRPKNDASKELLKGIDRLASVLPSEVPAQQFCVALLTAANQLTGCTPLSVGIAAFNCAQLGLMPGGVLGHAYLIPYGKQCTLVPGYRGLLDLAFNNSFLVDVHADVVLQGEEFDYWKNREGPQIHHKPALDRSMAKKDVVAAYCLYHTAAGGCGIKVVSKTELKKVDTGKNVWKSEYVAMAMKTAIRRASKEWKLTSRLALAVQLDEQAERGEVQSSQGFDAPTQPEFSLGDLPDTEPAGFETRET